MSHVLARGAGGSVCLPDPATIMIDRADGGQLVVLPPRPVWDRTALTGDELMAWQLLVAAAGRAMLDTLPQLGHGCLNYWDAGNWALNAAAAPAGDKQPREARSLHLHLCGRSRDSRDPSWPWGEQPSFPRFADRFAWSAGKTALAAAECVAIVGRIVTVLRAEYRQADAQGITSGPCRACGYPAPSADLDPSTGRCPGCRELTLG